MIFTENSARQLTGTASTKNVATASTYVTSAQSSRLLGVQDFQVRGINIEVV